MLETWVFLMMIEGKPEMAFPAATEAKCSSTMTKLLMVQRLHGVKASGACYVRATAIDDTERRLIGVPIQGARKLDLPGPDGR
ncbi:hypothetical protein AABC73_13465 [Pseudomonas sp. G.S.17]|uniref:hypothetical protein n=1 Tax=Pseudomonas sp. G.S.17 TaxID=3137451 RepID=UPI00311C90DC